MELFQELNIEKELQDSFVTVGVFDGVHLGHKYLMKRLIESARKNRKSAGIVTFKNHPATVINPKFQPNFLTNLETKLDLLEATGVDFVAAITFNSALAEFSAKDFLGLLKSEVISDRQPFIIKLGYMYHIFTYTRRENMTQIRQPEALKIGGNVFSNAIF